MVLRCCRAIVVLSACASPTAEWDPKITTFPGSYVVTVAWCRAMAAVGDTTCWRDDAAGLASLRRASAVLAAATAAVLYDVVSRLHRGGGGGGSGGGGVSRAALCMHTALLALWPAHWFFAFLSYTDAASSFFVLLTCVARRWSELSSVCVPACVRM